MRQGPTRVQSIGVFLLLLIAHSVLGNWNVGLNQTGRDFFQFWVIASELPPAEPFDPYDGEYGLLLIEKHARQSTVPGYSDVFREVAQNRIKLYATGSPFLYTLVAAFTTGRYEVDLRAFQLINLVCGLLGICGIARLLGFSVHHALLAYLYLATCFESFDSDIRVTNVGQIQLCLIALFLWTNRSPSPRWGAVSGAILAAAVAMKPTIIVVPILLLASRLANLRARRALFEFGGFAFCLLIVTILSSAAFRTPGVWLDFARFHFRALTGEYYTHLAELGNSSGMQIFLKGTGLNGLTILSIFFLVALLALVGLMIRAGVRTPEKAEESQSDRMRETWASTVLGCSIFLLISPLVWVHYYLLAVPVFLYFLRPNGGTHRIVRVVSVIALIGISIKPYILFQNQIVWLFQMKFRDALTIILMTSSVLLVILGSVEFVINTRFYSTSRQIKNESSD